MSYMSEEDIKRQNQILDQEAETLTTLLMAIGDWFANQPEDVIEDCREYIEMNYSVLDQETLNNFFGDKYGLPFEVTVDIKDLNVEDWTDEDEVEQVLTDFLAEAFGFCVKDFTWQIDTKDSGEMQQVIMSNIDWDLD